MANATLQEINESIQLLSEYRDRLQKEINTISKKLQIKPQRISSKLKEQLELQSIEVLINSLIEQRNKNIDYYQNRIP